MGGISAARFSQLQTLSTNLVWSCWRRLVEMIKRTSKTGWRLELEIDPYTLSANAKNRQVSVRQMNICRSCIGVVTKRNNRWLVTQLQPSCQRGTRCARQARSRGKTPPIKTPPNQNAIETKRPHPSHNIIIAWINFDNMIWCCTPRRCVLFNYSMIIDIK